MKTIIVKATSQDREKIITFIKKLEKYTDRQIKDAVICTRYLNTDNYNTVIGELKDATSLDDYDLFIVDVNVCDFKKEGITGSDIIYSIKKRVSNAKILAYTMADRIWDIRSLLNLGVNGLVYKGSTELELSEAVVTLMKGDKYYCSHFRQMMVENNYLNPDSYLLKCKLNPMEVAIIRCAAYGMTSKEISSYMKRSINTIMDYRKRLFVKFGVNSMEQLLMKAFSNGFPLKSNKNIFEHKYRTIY